MAELVGLPYSDDMKLILKISYNIGADTSLVLFGLTQGVNNMNAALEAEQHVLPLIYGIPDDQVRFVDGEGAPGTAATSGAVVKMLSELSRHATFSSSFDALPILGVDASLAGITDFQSDNTLAGATGQVRAKTGTNIIDGGLWSELKCLLVTSRQKAESTSYTRSSSTMSRLLRLLLSMM